MRINLLAALVAACTRHARLTVLAGVLLGALGALSASTRLGVSTDTDAMFAASLPWRQRAIAMDRDFPQAKALAGLAFAPGPPGGGNQNTMMGMPLSRIMLMAEASITLRSRLRTSR